jgi:hypothetical protein
MFVATEAMCRAIAMRELVPIIALISSSMRMHGSAYRA